ncbi:MAG: ATP:cob(I)alamin adenosyltransferase [Oscillospiraceae bacterium]|nr:MAG: ATP:cob(I)alamin adenosyltransferase [Oscillospiraceae bacterium]
MGNGKPEKGTLYTGNGDKGLTSLLPSSQVSKADERVAAIGGAEESVAALGLVRCVTVCPDFAGKLVRVQTTLRTLAAGLADPRSGKFVFSSEEIAFLESDTDRMVSVLTDKRGSDWQGALPGGCEQSARLDAARSTVRRAERALIAMDRRYAVPGAFKVYMNRLGDWLLAAARYADWLSEEEKEKAAREPVAAETAPAAAVVPAPADAAPVDPTVENVLKAVLARVGGGSVLDLERATRLIAAVERKALSEGKQAVIAVANAQGNPVAVHVMDGAFLVSYEVAVRKAYTAVAVKMPTAELARLVQPGGTFYGLQNLDRIVTFGGGVPLYENGVLIGGLGVSGGTGEEDHALAVWGRQTSRTLKGSTTQCAINTLAAHLRHHRCAALPQPAPRPCGGFCT